MQKYLILHYHYKGTKMELKLIKLLCHIAKNVYNNSLYLIRREYSQNGIMPLFKNIASEIETDDYKRLDIHTGYELYSRAFNAFKLYAAYHDKDGNIKTNIYKARSTTVPANSAMPRFLNKDGFSTLVFKGIEFDLHNMTAAIPIKVDKLIEACTDQELKDYLKGMKREFIDIKLPRILKDPNKKPIHIKIVPNRTATYFTIYLLYSTNLPSPKHNNGRILAMDLGVSNLATCVDTSYNSFIIDGRYLKSILHLYNKRIAEAQAKLPIGKNGKQIGTSKFIESLNRNMKNKIDDYLNKSVAKIIGYAVENNINTIVIGWNKGLTKGGVKMNIDTTKKERAKINQSFVGIPFESFREKIKIRCAIAGIRCVEIDESYTSVKSFYDNDSFNDEPASGKRIARGLYRLKDGRVINADTNAGLNILRKYAFKIGIKLEKPDKLIIPYRVYIYKKKS